MVFQKRNKKLLSNKQTNKQTKKQKNKKTKKQKNTTTKKQKNKQKVAANPNGADFKFPNFCFF
jgi:hypothetical protein